MQAPVVSVIVPNYNHAGFLSRRLESIINQTYQEFELIILDDRSTDNSAEIIESYRSHIKVTHICYNQTNSGSPFVQWKMGIDLAQGKYIWIAESDDYADVNFLETLINSIEGDSVVMAYTNSYIVENDKIDELATTSAYYNTFFETTRWQTDYLAEGEDELNNFLGGFCTIANASSCLFLRSAFPVDRQDELKKFKYCGDWFTWIEICKKGGLKYISTPLNYFRIHDQSTVRNFEKVRKAKELYSCLIHARELTNGRSLVPKKTLDILFYMWCYDSLYFFFKNFDIKILRMHFKLDVGFFGRMRSLFTRYYRGKFKLT